jgi:hypothetical protein
MWVQRTVKFFRDIAIQLFRSYYEKNDIQPYNFHLK